LRCPGISQCLRSGIETSTEGFAGSILFGMGLAVLAEGL
jgi:hypothetical protein